MNQKFLSGLLTMILLFTLTACSNTDEEVLIQMKPILNFTGDKEENVKFLRTKEYDGMTIKEYQDSKYFYEVTPEGKLMTIFLKTPSTIKASTLATKDEIALKSEDNLKRLEYQVENYKTEISYDEAKKQYQSVSREMQGEFFTGNNVYIQYSSDGILISISFKYEDPSVLQTINKITVEEAKEIIMNYFKTNASTEKFAPLLKEDMISHEVDVYNNKKVYNLYFTLQADEFGYFDFKYVVNTESGIILYRKELR